MNTPISLLEGEQLLLSSPTRYLLTTPTGWGYNPINGTLILTNQRIVFKPDGAVMPMQRAADEGAVGQALRTQAQF